MHCHQVWDHQRKGDPSFKNEDARKVYPLAENLGMTLDVDRPRVVKSVQSKSAAARAGIRARDVVVSANDVPIYSGADLSWVLHYLKDGARLVLKTERGSRSRTARLRLTGTWRERPIQWRGSMWPLRPSPGFGGEMLSDKDRRTLGLRPGTFAFRIRYVVTWGNNAWGQNARKAGIRKGDVVVGAGGKNDFSTVLDFHEWFRMTQKSGSVIQIDLIRGGKRLKVKLPIA